MRERSSPPLSAACWVVPWIDVSEPYAKPPRRTGPKTATEPVDRIEIDDQWAELNEVEVNSDVLDLSGCSSLEISSSRLIGLRFENPDGVEVEAHNVAFTNCDLSRVRFKALTASSLTSCKLTGTDFGGGLARDSHWSSCRLSLANFRMAELERIVLEDCVIEETDFFDASLTDVAVPRSELRDVNVDRVRFERVDLRGARELGLGALPRLTGVLVTPEQLPGLSFAMAAALGADIENP